MARGRSTVTTWRRAAVAGLLFGCCSANAQETEASSGFFDEGAGTAVLIIGAFFVLFLVGVGVYVYRYLKQSKQQEEAAAAYAFNPDVVPPVDADGMYKPYAQQYLTPQQQMMLMMQAEAGMMPVMSGVHHQESASFHSHASRAAAAAAAGAPVSDSSQPPPASLAPGGPSLSHATMSAVSLSVSARRGSDPETKPEPLAVTTIPSTDGDDAPHTARGGTVFSHAPSVEAQQSMRANSTREQQRPPLLNQMSSMQSMTSDLPRQPGQPSPARGIGSRRTMGSRTESKMASERAVNMLTQVNTNQDELVSLSDDDEDDLVAQAIAAVASPVHGAMAVGTPPPKTPEHFHRHDDGGDGGDGGARKPPRDSLSLRSLESL